MQNPTLWWLLVAAAVAAELVTGTFYLLMVALGLAAGALAAHAGASAPAQLVLAALVGGGAVAFWTVVRTRRPEGPPASANPDINLDVGATVQVHAWRNDGTAHVHHRGAQWTAVPADPAHPTPGPHRVQAVVGSQLVLERI